MDSSKDEKSAEASQPSSLILGVLPGPDAQTFLQENAELRRLLERWPDKREMSDHLAANGWLISPRELQRMQDEPENPGHLPILFQSIP